MAKSRRALKVEFTLNGRKLEVEVKDNQTLLDLLRDELGVKSVKKGCEQGECGVCTIILDELTANSCMVLAPMVEGRAVTTMEGLKDKPLMISLKDAFMENGAVQCGFCTPGMLISSYVLLKENPKPDEEEVKRAIVGNICRCTGYVNIIKAILDASERIDSE